MTTALLILCGFILGSSSVWPAMRRAYHNEFVDGYNAGEREVDYATKAVTRAWERYGPN